MTDDETAIRPLDEDTVARIAAGEVVERPASAVKELVENSLDADATRIDVAVEAGGAESIRVADDGRGMTEADLRAAVRQHTTSKIAALEDLESGVPTLGFRGEALHTIGSVSRLTIESRPRADRSDRAADAGTKLVYEGGEVTSVEPTGCPDGTIVEVTDLFYNTPARRKFLKTTATEFAHVNRVVTRYALANPDVAVSLSHDGREVFATTGRGDLRAAVLAVYGREVASSMIPVEADGAALPAGPIESLSGLVSHPETNRSTPEYLATYVNGRAVAADSIREGIMRAYGGQLGSDRYPFVVVFLEVPGEAVDVNVHPRKREVRFDDADAVRRGVESAVESALLDHGLLRSRAPRGRSAPDEARVEPEGAGDGAAPADAAAAGADDPASGTVDDPGRGAAAEGLTDEGRSTDPGRDDAAGARPVSEASTAGDSPPGGGQSPSPDADGAADRDRGESPRGATDAQPRSIADRAGSRSSGDGTAPAPGDEPRKSGPTRTAHPAPSRKFDGETEQRTLDGEAATGETTTFESLPSLRVLGQLHDTYLVCETPDGLALIDQHAADERVNYERLRAAFASDAGAQALATPVEVELTAGEAEAFERYREALSRLGFYADRVDDRTVAVTTVPAVLAETVDPDRLRDVLAAFVAGDREAGAETVDALADAFLADLACYPSITGNTSLTEGSVVDLLAALDDCENPYACPHGRPVVVQYDGREIDDRFERDYPGHGG